MHISADDWLYLPEKEVIWTTITFLTLQNLNDIKSLSTSEQFIYTMIAFLGKENIFLDPDVKTLLADFVQTFKSQEELNFNSKFGGKIHIGLLIMNVFVNMYLDSFSFFRQVQF